MTRFTKEEIDSIYKKAADRKAKRLAKGTELGLRKKKVKKTSTRNRAFNRLEEKCKQFVMLRANFRNSGFCEVGLSCGGEGNAEVWYHIFPQALGNGTRYDHRAIVASCHACNAGEYNARKASRDTYVEWHKKLLGEEEYAYLKSLTGRRPISTAEAEIMGDAYKDLIKREAWKLSNSGLGLTNENIDPRPFDEVD